MQFNALLTMTGLGNLRAYPDRFATGSCGSATGYCTAQTEGLLTGREVWIFRFSGILPASSEVKPQSGPSDPEIELPESAKSGHFYHI